MEITIIPVGGLCNRMNTILSAIALNKKKKSQYQIKIYWAKNNECHADFHELFQTINHDNITILPLDRFYLRTGAKKNLFFPKLIQAFKLISIFNGNLIADLDFENLVKGKKKVYISSSNRFCPYEIQCSIADYFKPTNEIENKINEICKNYTNNTIGVHIRRTDNKHAIKNSPIEKFVTLINNELRENPNTIFYLATDDLSTKKEMQELFPNKIITQEWELKRNTTNGMKDAVADLFCLGRTKKIIGSNSSTYSFMASHLYDIPIII